MVMLKIILATESSFGSKSQMMLDDQQDIWAYTEVAFPVTLQPIRVWFSHGMSINHGNS